MADAIVLTKALHHLHISQTTSENALDSGEYDRRSRACLRCKTVFDSAWAGERICLRYVSVSSQSPFHAAIGCFWPRGSSAAWILGLQVGHVSHQYSRALHRAGAFLA